MSIEFPQDFKRQFEGPLDIDMVFSGTSNRTDYLTSPRRYAGQIVSDNETSKAYILNSSKDTWVEIGAGGSTDNVFTEIGVDGETNITAVSGQTILNIRVGTGLELSTDNVTKKLTITNTSTGVGSVIGETVSLTSGETKTVIHGTDNNLFRICQISDALSSFSSGEADTTINFESEYDYEYSDFDKIYVQNNILTLIDDTGYTEQYAVTKDGININDWEFIERIDVSGINSNEYSNYLVSFNGKDTWYTHDGGTITNSDIDFETPSEYTLSNEYVIVSGGLGSLVSGTVENSGLITTDGILSITDWKQIESITMNGTNTDSVKTALIPYDDKYVTYQNSAWKEIISSEISESGMTPTELSDLGTTEFETMFVSGSLDMSFYLSSVSLGYTNLPYFPASTNGVYSMIEISGTLYAGTGNGINGTAKVYKYTETDWEDTDFYNAVGMHVINMAYYKDYLYVVTNNDGIISSNYQPTVQRWNLCSGISWETAKMGSANDRSYGILSASDGYLYACGGSARLSSVQPNKMYRTTNGTSWTDVSTGISGNRTLTYSTPCNRPIAQLTWMWEFNGYIYASSTRLGYECVRSSNGTSWSSGLPGYYTTVLAQQPIEYDDNLWWFTVYGSSTRYVKICYLDKSDVTHEMGQIDIPDNYYIVNNYSDDDGKTFILTDHAYNGTFEFVSGTNSLTKLYDTPGTLGSTNSYYKRPTTGDNLLGTNKNSPSSFSIKTFSTGGSPSISSIDVVGGEIGWYTETLSNIQVSGISQTQIESLETDNWNEIFTTESGRFDLAIGLQPSGEDSPEIEQVDVYYFGGNEKYIINHKDEDYEIVFNGSTQTEIKNLTNEDRDIKFSVII